MTSYGDLLARQQVDAIDGLFSHVKRLRWSSDRIAAERQRKLRELLAWAIERSPFHAERLREVDPATFTESDLSLLPVLTKDEMMEHFDEAVTHRGLTVDTTNDHLARLTTDGYLFDRFRVFASGGSSGRRGIFAYDWDEWVTMVLMERRAGIAGSALRPSSTVSLFSNEPAHISGALHAFGRDPEIPLYHIPMTTPIDAIVDRLNEIEPELVQGYPTALNLLVAEARRGRLRISPRWVKTCGELLTAGTRHAVRDVWGSEISDSWGVSEGVYTSLCEAGSMHLPDDLVVIEPVDDRGNPVAPGDQAAKIYLTNLYNLTQPLIRYEITDSMFVDTDKCACGSAHSRISSLRGRQADTFVYPDGATVHPAALEGSLFRDHRVIEYRVWQTLNGVEVTLRTDGAANLSQIRADLFERLQNAHLVNPDVTVRTADRLDRVWSGKLNRFVPLQSAGAGNSLN